MRYKMIVLTFFLYLFIDSLNANPNLGFSVGYTVNNTYTDIEGLEIQESRIPLLGLKLGYNINLGYLKFLFVSETKFFGMDIVRGNRDITLFVTPRIIMSIPFRIKEVSFSPLTGYGGIYKRRYIKEKTYLEAENRFINSADDERKNIGFLLGGIVSYSDWLTPTFFSTIDISSFYSISLLLRTPESEKNSPYINITYTGGETRIISLGLTFLR